MYKLILYHILSYHITPRVDLSLKEILQLLLADRDLIPERTQEHAHARARTEAGSGERVSLAVLGEHAACVC